MPGKINNSIVVSAAVLYMTLFIYAATSKLLDFHKFQFQISQSPLLTRHAVFISWGVPAFEFSIAILLFISSLRLLGLYLSFSLMIMFTLYIIIITRFNENTPCSCGGVLQHLSWNQHLIFNFAFIILAVIAIFAFGVKARPGEKPI